MFRDLPNRWYAVQARPLTEKMVESHLQYKGYEVFLPAIPMRRPRSKRVTGEQARPLFPGYLFCRVGPRAFGPIVTTPGVVRIVGAGRRWEPIDDQEIEDLKTVVRSGLPVRPWPRLEDGVRVEVVCGPLRGCRGTYKTHRDENHLLISLTLLQRSVTVAIQLDWIVPLEAGPGLPVAASQLPMAAGGR